MRLRFGLVITLAGALAAGEGFLRAQNTASPQPPDQRQEPYVSGRDGVTPPRVVSDVKPGYTPEAVRARIEGAVRMRGIVERDGTISSVEVVQSLDSVNGLDQAAIDALKQWRFEPGTLSGQPVRVLITVDMTFNLRGAPATQAWPQGFDALNPTSTVAEVADAAGLRLRISRPADWTIRRAGVPREWVSLHSADNLQNVAVQQPEPTSLALTWPVAQPTVQRLAEAVRQSLPGGGGQTLATGQIEAHPGMFWVWSLLRVPAVPTPPGISPAANPFGEARIWVFSHTVGANNVTVLCQALFPRNLPASALDERMQRAASDFRSIVESIAIEKTAN